MKILPFYGNSAQPAHIEIEETAERMTLLDGGEKLFDRDFRGIQEKKGVIAGWLFTDLCTFYGEAAELFLQFPEFLAKRGPGERKHFHRSGNIQGKFHKAGAVSCGEQLPLFQYTPVSRGAEFFGSHRSAGDHVSQVHGYLPCCKRSNCSVGLKVKIPSA